MTALRLADLATEELIALRGLLTKAGPPDEARDEHGQWTAGGGGIIGDGSPKATADWMHAHIPALAHVPIDLGTNELQYEPPKPDPELLRDAAYAYANLGQRFPQTVGKITAISTKALDQVPVWMAFREQALAATSNTNEVRINPLLFSQPDKAEAIFADDRKSGWSAGLPTFEGTIDHEFGHVLANVNPAAAALRDGIWGQYRPRISGYAKTSAGENWAENVTAALATPPAEQTGSVKATYEYLRTQSAAEGGTWDLPPAVTKAQAPRTVRIASGGRRRDVVLRPIVARVRAKLIALAAELGNRPDAAAAALSKGSSLGFADAARAVLAAGYRQANRSGVAAALAALADQNAAAAETADAAYEAQNSYDDADAAIDPAADADALDSGDIVWGEDPLDNDPDEPDPLEALPDDLSDPLGDNIDAGSSSLADKALESLLGIGALLIGGTASFRQVDAWLGGYAASLNAPYEEGFGSGLGLGNDVLTATWHTQEDGTVCALCDGRDGQTWTYDDPDLPYPGEGYYGDQCEGGPNCRCELVYDVVPGDAEGDQLAAIAKYSPDEARDETGKWTAGGGGANGQAAIDRAYGTMFPSKKEATFANLTERVAVKARLAKSLASALDRQFGPRLASYKVAVHAQLAYLANQHLGLRPEGRVSPGTEVADYLVTNWAESAADNRPESLALQIAAQNVFGLKGTDDPLKNARTGAQAGRDYYAANKEVYDAFAREVYGQTQDWLKAEGVGPRVTLWRGTDQDIPQKPTTTVRTYPLSSWAGDQDTAREFGGNVLNATVPTSRIWSTPFTGPGCLTEDEYIVLGGEEPVNLRTSESYHAATPDTVVNIDATEYDWPKRTPDTPAALGLPPDLATTDTPDLTAFTTAELVKLRALLVKYSPDQPRDDAGRWTAGGDTVDVAGERHPVSAALSALAAGRRPSINAREVHAFMKAALAYQGPPLDLTELAVRGTMKFGGDGLGYTRASMPQIPDADRPAFFAELRDRGFSVTPETADPAELHPIQKEINAHLAAGIWQAMQEGKDVGGPILVSKDDYVLDGHHHWAAATALSLERGGGSIAIDRIGMDHAPLLDYAERWDTAHGIAHQGMTPPPGTKVATPDLTTLGTAELLRLRTLLRKYSPDQPRDEYGRWAAGGGDASRLLTNAADSWARYGYEGMRRSLAAGRPTTEARALAQAVAGQNEPVKGKLYRGLNIENSGFENEDMSREEVAAAFVPGKTVDLNLSSWTTNRGIAINFAGTTPQTGYLLEVEGAKALNLSDHDRPGPVLPVELEHEWLTDGRFRVLGVTSGPAYAGAAYQATTVRLAQEAVFTPPQLAGTKAAIASIPWSEARFHPAIEAAMEPRMARTRRLHKFDPSEPRDASGQWTAGGDSTTDEASKPWSQRWQELNPENRIFDFMPHIALRGAQGRAEFSPEEKVALKAYQTSSNALNRALRFGTAPPAEDYYSQLTEKEVAEYQHTAATLDKAISEKGLLTGEEMTVYRGIAAPHLTGQRNRFDQSVGRVIEDKGFLSTLPYVTSRHTKDFGSSDLQIHVPAGTPYIALSGDTEGLEYLFGSGSKLRIDDYFSAKETGGRPLFKATMLP